MCTYKVYDKTGTCFALWTFNCMSDYVAASKRLKCVTFKLVGEV